MTKGLILPQCDVLMNTFWGIDNSSYLKGRLNGLLVQAVTVCFCVPSNAPCFSDTHIYKQKICSRCLTIMRVAWGSRCGKVLVGLPLGVSWKVCGAQIRLIYPHLVWSINRYKCHISTKHTVCDCVYCILLTLHHVLRKTHLHTNAHHNKHTKSLPKIGWLSNENNRAEVKRLCLGWSKLLI